jgi:Ca2+/Na+ antiporter
VNEPRHSAFAKAVCLDLPYILDSVWRRAEFNVNRLVRYEIDVSPAGSVNCTLAPRPYTRVSTFWLFLATLVFVAYGPTFDAWCSVVGADGMRYSRTVLGVAGVLSALIVWGKLIRFGEARTRKRFLKAPVPQEEFWRRLWVRAGVQLAVLAVALALGRFGVYLFESRNAAVCRVVPSDDPARYQAILLLGVICAAAVLARRPLKSASRLRREVVLLLGMVVLLWVVIAPSWASEANQSPYVHTFGVFACLLALLALLLRPLARWQFGSVSDEQRESYRAALRDTELFPGPRVDPDISTRRVVAALATGIFYHLLEFLLLPSLFALMVPSRYLGWTILSFSVFAAWLLTMGNFTARWRAMVSQVRRWFLVGTPLAVSIAVIAIAILRFAKVQYVTTVLDAAPFGVIFVWIIMAYALLWWFEFSVNSAVAAELIRVVGTDDDVDAGYLKYLPDKVPPEQRTVELNDRFIAAHGAGRFAVLGWFRDKDSGEPLVAFQTFDLVELFARLTPPALSDLRQDFTRRIELYFLTVNALVIALLLAGYGYYGYGDRHNTVASVVTAKSMSRDPQRPDLAELLRAHRRVFIVAASGGGTRAALFTAAALEGLNKLGVAKDIVLLSGVSGGGVAEAYFYTHRDALLAAVSPANAEWPLFKDRMTEPFIGDVLEGAAEWRLLSRAPLGQLLVESFERRLFPAGDRPAAMGASNQLALILNATIAAHPQEDSDLLRGLFAAPEDKAIACNALHMPYASMGGGRLIFTNLADRDAFPPSGALPPADTQLHIPDVRLPYVVVQDRDVPVAGAAALNANFPPIFTNARVDVAGETQDTACPERSYYVTDGGATENLGLLSALYALRAALKQLHGQDVPEIHIVTIEASATAYDYTPDRGLDAAKGGAKERLTGGLTQELLDEAQELARPAAGDDRRIQVHDLALPLAFRSRGGFGTHWMFPDSIVVENPRAARPLIGYERLLAEWFASDPPSAVIDKTQLIELWTALHEPDQRFCSRSWKNDPRRVADWICGKNVTGGKNLPADIHVTEWRGLIDSLTPSAR